jgi:hypothetical protein
MDELIEEIKSEIGSINEADQSWATIISQIDNILSTQQGQKN